MKALLDLEKSKSKRKQDLLTAQRAEKERKAASGLFRRAQRRNLLDQMFQEERELLLEKLDIQDNPLEYGVKVGKGVIAPLGGSCG